MIEIYRHDQGPGWHCVIALANTPAKYYAVDGSKSDSPHVRGDGDTPQTALDAALRALGALTIANPPDAGRRPQQGTAR